ncbi:MAG: hypothetical protein ACOQNV_01070 [Mycoplasmoidaceae bacterium]
MKLKRKLIPVLGLAATSLTVTPLALTSCSKNTSNSNGMVNLLEKFIPRGKQHPYDEMPSPVQANETFLAEANKEKIFVQDMIWGKYKFIDYLMNSRFMAPNPNLNQGFKAVTAKVALAVLVLNSMSNVHFGISNVTIESKTFDGHAYPIISYDVDYEIDYDVYYETVYEQDVGKMTGKIKVTDLPYSFDNTMAETGDPSLWSFAPARNIIVNHPEHPWSIDYYVNRKEIQTITIRGAIVQKEVDESLEYRFTYENWQDQGEIPSQIIQALCFPETKMVKTKTFVAGQVVQAIGRYDVNQGISNGLFTLASFSWYMLPVPIRPITTK